MNKLVLIVLTMIAANLAFAGAAPKSSPELIAKGKAAYTTNCVICHGDKGDGNGPAGAALNPKPRNFAKDLFKGKDGKGKIKSPTAKQVFDVVTNGITGTSMAAFSSISEEERWGLAYYVLTIRNGK